MPFKFPIVGTLPDFMMRGGVDNLRDIYEDMYKEYGDVFGMSIMGEDELILSDPRAFDQILRKEGKYPVGGAELVSTFVDYYKETNNTMGMKSSGNGPGWKEWRSGLDREMYVEWKGYLPAIAKAAAKISKVAGYEVTERKNIAFVDFISRSAFDLFSAVMYGESPQTTDSRVAEDEDIEFVAATQTAFELTGEILTNPLEKVLETDTYQMFKENMENTFRFGYDQADRFVDELAERKLTAASKAGEEESKGETSKCPVTAIKNNLPFVEKLVENGKVSTNDIIESSGPLLMAGVDTTAYVMGWLFLNLATNPDAQSALAKELKAVLDGADVTTAEQMDSLPYLRACIRESHRLTPTSAISPKVLKQDVDLTVEGATYRVPAGQRVSLNLRAWPMDTKFVEDPTSFRPERFLPEAVEARRGTPSEILDHPSFVDPFGRGKRRCLGSNVAVAEITVLAARMLQDYELSLEDAENAEWSPKQKLVLKADPYPDIRLVPRTDDVLPML